MSEDSRSCWRAARRGGARARELLEALPTACRWRSSGVRWPRTGSPSLASERSLTGEARTRLGGRRRTGVDVDLLLAQQHALGMPRQDPTPAWPPRRICGPRSASAVPRRRAPAEGMLEVARVVGRRWRTSPAASRELSAEPCCSPGTPSSECHGATRRPPPSCAADGVAARAPVPRPPTRGVAPRAVAPEALSRVSRPRRRRSASGSRTWSGSPGSASDCRPRTSGPWPGRLAAMAWPRWPSRRCSS